MLFTNGQKITTHQGHGPDHVHVADHKVTSVPTSEVVTEHIVVGYNVHHQHIVPEHAKVSVQIPPQVQQVVTQVSQHVPVVVQEHVAKQRSQRSIMETPRKCDFKCADTDLPICASNGRCHRQFENHCELSAHNCLYANKSKYFLVPVKYAF